MDRREMMALVSSAAVIKAVQPEVKILDSKQPIALVCKASIPVSMKEQAQIMEALKEIGVQVKIPVLFASAGFDFEVVDYDPRNLKHEENAESGMNSGSGE